MNDDEDSFQSSSRISSSHSEAEVAPKKPERYSRDELDAILREELGYDQLNIFKDDEVDREGMARLNNLKTAVDIEQEIQKRREEINQKIGFIEY